MRSLVAALLRSESTAGESRLASDPWRVGWTRGGSCRALAEALGGSEAQHIGSNLAESCVDHRIDVLVAPRLSSFDLVPVAVPHDVDLTRVEAVTIAVSDGPHSELAVHLGARLAARLGVPGEIVTAHRTERELGAALSRLEYLALPYPRLDRRDLRVETPAALTEALEPGTLLVLGAPGGSWLHRHILGPGHRLAVAAPGGAVAVRSAPRRCFHGMLDGLGATVEPTMAAGEARRIIHAPSLPVTDAGRLVGIVRRRRLDRAAADALVATLMEPPVALSATEPLEAAGDLRERLDGGPVPVVGPTGRLIGTIPSRGPAPPATLRRAS